MNATEIEEKIAHLTRSIDELSDELIRQNKEIETLTRQVTRLVQRAANSENEGTGGVILGDERPPHY
ncbi:SlyX family protein [Alphaproteobacteria bacterium KMM 3653]|uniref:SlyX family protein n=1 Tax=Harenicola maris TaxID=2841044 RepID=A0AAP2CU96_9RHOB|nr:SlyX family protein [Harenicola maris]